MSASPMHSDPADVLALAADGASASRERTRTLTGPDPTVRDGVRAACQRLLPGSIGSPRSFLLADGPDMRQGEQTALVAWICARESGVPSVVCGEGASLRSTAEAARRLGLTGDSVEFVEREAFRRRISPPSDGSRGLLAVLGAEDITSNPGLRRAVDRSPASRVMFVADAAFANVDQAVYFASRVQGVGERRIRERLGDSIEDFVPYLGSVYEEMQRSGGMMARERPFWGKSAAVHAWRMSPAGRKEQQDILATWGRAWHLQDQRSHNRQWSRSLQRELEAISDRELVPHAADEVEARVRAGRKVIFFGKDTDHFSPIRVGADEQLLHTPGFLASLGAELERRSIPVARLEESPGGDGRNERELRRFLDGDGKRDYRKSEVAVLLAPPSLASELRETHQRWHEAPQVSVLGTIAPGARERFHADACASRRDSCGPAESATLVMDSFADARRMACLGEETRALRALGNSNAARYSNLVNAHETALRAARDGVFPPKSGCESGPIFTKIRDSERGRD